MTLAFAGAVQKKEAREVFVSAPRGHEAIASMFPNVRIKRKEELKCEGEYWTVHPTEFQGDISRFALLGHPVTHADLWRAMLNLPLDEPMARGVVPEAAAHPKGKPTAVIITKARSWPNHHQEFWQLLMDKLVEAGWYVWLNHDSAPLDDLLKVCAGADWVIGPQCGVMAIICHAMFPCRKTICTPSVEGTGWIVPTTYPYAYVTTFAGEDYGDVEEVVIVKEFGTSVHRILQGPHFNRAPVKQGLVSGVNVSLTYGDFFDRMSVLEIKVQKLTRQQAANVYREYQRYCELLLPMIRARKELAGPYADLLIINRKAWDHNETAVPDALANRPMQDHHAAAIRLNKERVWLKNLINELCGSASQEIKSYYKDQP